MKNIKICLVSDTVFDINGVSRFIQDFSKQALKFEKDFVVLTSTKKVPEEEFENIININPIFRMKMPFYKSLDLVFPNFFKIKEEIKRLNPDLLHISTPGTVGLSALICAKLLKIPVVGIYHTDFPAYLYKNTKKSFVKKGTIKFLKFFYSPYKALFCRSEEYFKTLKEQLNFEDEELYLLKAGIDIKSFDSSFKDNSIWEKYKVDKSRFKVLYVGRVSLEKNVHKLLAFWQKAELKNSQLILVGDKELKEQISDPTITYLGKRRGEELSKIYASSDCFIFPSTTDTLGQVVMEALSSGLPAIVTNKGGPKTFVTEKFGYILDINSFDEVKKALEELSKKDEKYYQKSKKAYEYMRDKSISHSFLDFWQKNEEILSRLKA
ncbi:glycosyltransferase [Halarcobacter anaerophilus]|uniref:Group 1 glycosyl transferase n=1 Tax=Halarcobacter anaerophilus TaxID=877500 RepID=A0A4Q0XVJ2_9BACT|nr:glycosyltransferase [Halarcobacter anaerophilus]RXJ61173.1 group 1 glycosyl transferase [Halarcobacter anaerophilus]